MISTEDGTVYDYAFTVGGWAVGDRGSLWSAGNSIQSIKKLSFKCFNIIDIISSIFCYVSILLSILHFVTLSYCFSYIKLN